MKPRCSYSRGGLPGPEGDDAAHGIVGGDTHGDTVAGNDFDAETPHPAAQLREDFVPRIALDAIQPAGVDRDDGPLHVNQIVFAQ